MAAPLTAVGPLLVTILGGAPLPTPPARGSGGEGATSRPGGGPPRQPSPLRRPAAPRTLVVSRALARPPTRMSAGAVVGIRTRGAREGG